MKSAKIAFAIAMGFLVAGCGNGGSATVATSDGGGNTSGGGGTTTAAVNVIPITVNGSGCSDSYPNKPCVSVTVCTPDGTSCQTVNDILLDTGSTGLRLFSSAIGISLPTVSTSEGTLAECIQYLDGSSEWGPVASASIMIGDRTGAHSEAVTVPIHLLNAGFSSAPPACGSPEKSPAEAGFNGILGIGLFSQDCGSYCVSNAVNQFYYSCSNGFCSGTKAPLEKQVRNPVVDLPTNNNGVVLKLPSVPLGGVVSTQGELVLGIGTRSNNDPAGATAFPTDESGQFSTRFTQNGFTVTYSSFIDSGSNGLFVPPRNELTACNGGYVGWFCPPSVVTLTATNVGNDSTTTGDVTYQIGNASTLLASSNNVFSELGGDGGSYFDWGLPFFFGKNVYYGVEGKSSSLGTGPYVAY